MGGPGQRLGDSFGAVRDVLRSRDLRRLLLAWAGSVLGNWGYLVALVVYAYEQGGAPAVGLVGVVRMLPSALAAPFTAVLADRFSRTRVMVGSDLVRAVLTAGAAAVIVLEGPAWTVYALVALSSVAGTAFRPAQAALLPSLARTPAELTAANVASSTVESIGMFAGPALGGLVLAVTDPGTVFALNAATFVWSAFLVAGIGAAAAPEPGRRRADEAAPGFLQQTTAGFAALAADSRARLLVALYTVQTLVAGMLAVFLAVTALRILETGEAGVGALNSAIGAGGIVGAFVAVALTSRGRLAGDFALGLALFGAPLALVGIWPEAIAAFLFICVVGIGNTVVDVAAMTLMQRSIADDVLARVFGVLESLLLGAMALGAVLAPLLVAWLGPRGALVAGGAVLPVAALVALPALRGIDAQARLPGPELELLRRLPIFAPLPAPALERLASSLARVEVAAGETVLRRGEEGDRFYVVERGSVRVTPADRPARELGAGEGFGEIALLRDVPRTADVTALEHSTLLALGRDDFIAVVTGHPGSAEAADAVIASRLDSLRAGVASV